jgi:branched-chain amino acid transport system permease protein
VKARYRQALVALGAAALLAVPLVVSDRYVLKVLTFVGVNSIIVVGLALLFGFAGQVSLGHAAFFGIGAYASAYLAGTLRMPWPASLAAAVAVAALAGWAVAMPSLRLKGHYLAMATLGFNEIMSVVFIEAKAVTGGIDGTGNVPFPSLGALELRTPATLYLLVWGVALLVIAAAANVVRRKPGRAMRALHATEPGAAASGVNVAAVKVQTFALSAALAGLAGALYAHTVGFISPSTFGLDLSILLMASVVLGGRESLAGPLAAMAVFTLLPYAGALVPGVSRAAAETIQDWVPDLVGLTVVVVLIVKSRRGGLTRPSGTTTDAGDVR